VDHSEDGVAITEILGQVKKAIKVANLSGQDTDLKITKLKVGINAIATGTAGGGFDLQVPIIGMRLKAGGKVSPQDTHRIEVEMEPMPDRYEIRSGDVQRAIVDAAEAIRAISRSAMEGEDPFLVSKSSLSLSFLVTREGAITLGVEGELRDEITHHLYMEYMELARS